MRLHRFSLSEFSELKDQWQDLLSRSNADKLFLSWSWMYNWWEIYGGLNNDNLLLLGIYDDKNRLVCLAPFYLSTTVIKNIFTVEIIQFLGTRVGGSSGFRTEYLQCIVDFEASNSCVSDIFNYLHNEVSFDELWLHDLIVDSPTYKEAKKLENNPKIYKRVQSESQSYGVNVVSHFKDFVTSLGKNTRLKTYNRRKVLASLGDLAIETVNPDNYQDTLIKLSEFHLHRWEKEISYSKNSLFIEKLIADDSIQICGIIVRLDNEIIGCTIDILSAGRSYNFQSGYKDGIDKKVSMGSLTIGYAVELYCEKEDVKYYDFLAGEGKKSNYKARIAKAELHFESSQYVSTTILRYMYQFKDMLTSFKNSS